MFKESSVYQDYKVLVDEFTELRRKHNGQYSREEGLLLEKMTEVWMKMSEDERERSRFLLTKVPCAKRIC